MVGWVALLVCVFLGQLGALFQLPQAVLDLSPFTRIPQIPGADVSWKPLVILTLLAAAMIVVGLAAFRRRDIPVT
jgi:ABC-2 type transport system permease protein